MTHIPATNGAAENLDDFRARLRRWLDDNMPVAQQTRARKRGGLDDAGELAEVARNRELQRRLYDGGFAGITVPVEYGGAGLTSAHVDVFNEEVSGYRYPDRIQVPTFSPCMAILLEFGSEQLKRLHIPAMLRGDEIWMQFLSEPSGGSDVASAQTTARRDGDEWLLNGSKIWTTGAWWSDWALCLARTNWDVPKHRGLTVFILPIHQPGVEVNRIEMIDGTKEFCQEYLVDVRVPDSDRVGEINDGWTVGIRWMMHERSFHSSPHVVHPASAPGQGVGRDSLVELAAEAGRLDDPCTRELIGEARALELARRELTRRVSEAIALGRETEHAAAIVRLMTGITRTRRATLAFEIAGMSAVAWSGGTEDGGLVGDDYLLRQANQIGGGTTEIARNVISERVLGMPRERTLDKDVAFRDVPRGPTRRTA